MLMWAQIWEHHRGDEYMIVTLDFTRSLLRSSDSTSFCLRSACIITATVALHSRYTSCHRYRAMAMSRNCPIRRTGR